MIGIFHNVINDIPALVVVNHQQKDDALPLVVYFHGFTSAKEHNLPIAYLLALKGFRVVLPDSQYHGEREIKEMTEAERQLSFWKIVLGNVRELEAIKEYYEERKLIDQHRMGVAGTSMGGMTTAAALAQYDWIKAAAILMGTPKITAYAEYLLDQYQSARQRLTKEQIEQSKKELEDFDLSLHKERLQNRPLLLWHGENDSVIPFHYAYQFYQDVKPFYQQEQNLHFISEKERDHKVSRYAILETVKWFENHLS